MVASERGPLGRDAFPYRRRRWTNAWKSCIP